MKWTEKEINFLIENYNKLGRAECANKLNRSIDSVSTKIRDSNLRLSSKEIWSEDDLFLLKNNYENRGVDYCALLLGVDRRRIASKATNLGLKTLVFIKSESKNKKVVNYELFNHEVTKESVYILGLLWADGHVREENKTTSISCVQTDIEDVIPVFLSTGNWLISKPIKKYFNGNEVKTQKKIHTTTWGLFDVLKKYGFLDKSNGCPIDMIDKIPDKLKRYWFRGFLDGDGCIKLGKKYGVEIVFTSTINENWLFMKNLCEKLNISYSIYNKIIKIGGYSHFRINKKNDVKILCDYLYNNYDNIGFSRKYKKCLDVYDRIRKTKKTQLLARFS